MNCDGVGICPSSKKEEGQERNLQYQSAAASSTIMVLLPQEVIYDILTRVSLSNLLCQCRFVCKDWLRITQDSNFKLMHSVRNPTMSGFFIQMDDYEEGNMFHPKFVSSSMVQNDVDNQSASSLSVPSLSLDFTPANASMILASSSPHGLLFCTSWIGDDDEFSFDDYSYYVCKPATREWQKIPSPRTYISHTLQIAFVVLHSDPLHYKLIHFTAGYHNEYDCEMFDSNNWTWEVLDYKVDSFPPRPFKNYTLENGILVHGVVHWFDSENQEINGLDINDGSWKIISLPTKDEQLHEIYENSVEVQKKLVECEGKIELVCLAIQKSWLELWVVEDYYYYSKNETIRWNKNYRIDLKLGFSGYSIIRVMDFLYTKDTVLLTVNKRLLWYNLKDESVSIALDNPKRYWIHRVHRLQTDLIPWYDVQTSGN